mgnify:CR=1 FL=1
MSLHLDTIRECLEGVIPGHIATCDAEGTPNLAYLSQVQFIDNEHVALSTSYSTEPARTPSPTRRFASCSPAT